MPRVAAILLAVVLALAGILFQADPYRIRDPGHPADQQVLDHEDSSYAHISWVVSHDNNYAQLRFYDRVEGGVCLRPRWDEIAPAHLAMPDGYQVHVGETEHTWDDGLTRPNMGSLSNTKYINLYPLAVLLNRGLMDTAGDDPSAATPNILIVGLGSGVGVAMLAHHFPEASITVVDIDREVNEIVRKHYPLLRWLEAEAPPTSDGRKRLRLVAADARQAVIYPDMHGSERPFDIVILDAYTSGSTIPPHLMTREFFTEVGEAMAPGGVMLSNIIGSYTGPKRRLLGGAIRSMQAAGFQVHNFPIYQYEYGARRPAFDGEAMRETRNNIVIASREAVDPDGNRAGWASIDAFVEAGGPYPELPLRRYRSTLATLLFDADASMSVGLIAPDGTSFDPALHNAVLERYGGQPQDGRRRFQIEDQALIRRAVQSVRSRAAKAGERVPRGWERDDAQVLRVRVYDWVHHARSTFRTSVAIARSKATPSRFRHGARHLIGPDEEERSGFDDPDWVITDAPLFTDSMPNADIHNH